MEEFGFTYSGGDGALIVARRWTAPGCCRGIVQVAHGMGEHAGRYARFAQRLTQAGFAVYANDHRGHGRTASGALGDLGPGGFSALVDDMARLTSFAQAEHPGVPLVLFGHSMGSFATQLFILDHGARLAAVVLSGSAALDKRPARLAGRARLDGYNAAFRPGRTPFDWLSRDPAAVDAYLADPLCGFSLTPESRARMVAGGARTYDPVALRRLPVGLPIYLLTGDSDPVNGMLQSFHPLAERYAAAGLAVTSRIYPGGRHEMLNETNRDEVVADLLEWLGNVVEQRRAAA